MNDIEIARAAKMRDIREMQLNSRLMKANFSFTANTKQNSPHPIDPEAIKRNKLILFPRFRRHRRGGKDDHLHWPGSGFKTVSAKKATAVLREPSLGTRCLALRAELLAEGTPRYFRWKTSTCTLPATLPRSKRPTTCSPRSSTTTCKTRNRAGIDPRTVTWKRVMDMNDRALRKVVIGLGHNVRRTRKTGFDITTASEIIPSCACVKG